MLEKIEKNAKEWDQGIEYFSAFFCNGVFVYDYLTKWFPYFQIF
mgnify:CR=1 FL=1